MGSSVGYAEHNFENLRRLREWGAIEVAKAARDRWPDDEEIAAEVHDALAVLCVDTEGLEAEAIGLTQAISMPQGGFAAPDTESDEVYPFAPPSSPRGSPPRAHTPWRTDRTTRDRTAS